MGKRSRTGAWTAALAAAGLITSASVWASPVCNDRTDAEGCINVPGGKGVFDVTASYAVSSGAKSGTLLFADTAAGVNISSSTLLDYTDLEPNIRGFIFALSGGVFTEARVFLTDNGDSGDSAIIQLFLPGGIIAYEAGGFLTADCGGGVTIVSDCSTNPPPPEEETPKPGKGPKPPKPERPKGNNGVGNGIDPQPPGNPPINDGPGTGPGNPGNRGGARR